MQSPSSRASRWLAGTALATAAALLVTGCAPAGSGSEEGPKDTPKDAAFKVGVLAPLTGFFAAGGTDMKQGWDLYWEEHGDNAGDFAIETVLEDTGSDAETALSKAKRLVTEEKVDVVVGPILSNISLAIADYLTQQDVPNLALTAADHLTQDGHSPIVLRAGGYGGSQTAFAAGKWAAEQGHKTVATLCVDYAFGWENCGGFSSAFQDAGGTVLQQFWYPNNTPDLSTYVSQLKSAGADIAFVATSGGADSSNFLRSASDFGLLNDSKTELLTNCCTTDQATLQDVGDTALGITSINGYSEGTEVPEAKKFVEAFEAKYKALPSRYAVGAYGVAQMLAKTLDKASTKPVGADLVAAIKAVDLSDSVHGDVSFDDYNSLAGPMHIREVAKRADGKLWNVTVKTYPMVSQFWTYDAAEFLASPPFSQTHTSYTGK
jgi:branched-chain amino acid transport system substrate-binding protein